MDCSWTSWFPVSILSHSYTMSNEKLLFREKEKPQLFSEITHLGIKRMKKGWDKSNYRARGHSWEGLPCHRQDPRLLWAASQSVGKSSGKCTPEDVTSSNIQQKMELLHLLKLCFSRHYARYWESKRELGSHRQINKNVHQPKRNPLVLQG